MRHLAPLFYEARALLWDGTPNLDDDEEVYTCHAVENAVKLVYGQGAWAEERVALAFLRELGVHTDRIWEFDEFEPGPERQAVRYAWLTHVARLAREWRVTA